MEEIISILRRRNDELTAAQQPVIEALQKDLDSLEGKDFGSFEAKQRIASLIQELVGRLGMALSCCKEGCGQPAILRCYQPQRSTKTYYQFAHSIKGKPTTHGSYINVPRLKIIPPTPDRRRKITISE